MTAKESSIEEKLGEITECCICAEVYDDPRVLPCIHTFCLKCIQLTGNEKKPGEEMPCPICRTEFIIPATGFVGLKKNFFMSKLVEMAMLQKPAIREALCDVCRENADEEPISEIATATMYCTECRDHLCERCFRDHKRHKLSRDHQVIAIGSGTVQQEDLRRFRPSKCEQHVKEQLKLYCLPCKAVLCMMCYVEGHGTHQCSDVEKVAEDFRKDIEKDLDEIDIFLNECLTEKQEFEQHRAEVGKEIEKAQSAVILRGQNLKELIDKHTGQLLEELALIKQNKLKEMEAKNEELERQRTILDSFKMYCMEIKCKGSSGDICRVIKELQDRTGVLRQVVTNKKDNESQQKRLHIFFEPTSLEGFSKTYNIVGALKEETSQEVNPILFKTVITGLTDDSTAVIGFAILDKHIFIVSVESPEIEVYDSTSFIFECQRKLEELADPIDIASCNRNKCLYILNAKDEPMEIMRVDSMGKLINKWSTGENWGLSLFITKDSNILLPAHAKKRLDEYSPEGQLIRKIKLSSELSYPIHALKIADDKFVVSFAHYLYMDIDNDGHLSITSEANAEESETSDNDQKNLEEEKEEEEEGEKQEEEEEGDEEDHDEKEEENENESTSSDEEDNGSKKSTSSEEEDKSKNGSDTDDETEEKSNENGDSEEEESDKKINEHQVCIIDGNGDVIKSFGHAKGSGLGQLNCPSFLTIDREGQIIVADRGNSRVLLLSRDLEFRRELISRKQGFRHPIKVQLDESTGRLFVATRARKGNKGIGGSALFFRLK